MAPQNDAETGKASDALLDDILGGLGGSGGSASVRQALTSQLLSTSDKGNCHALLAAQAPCGPCDAHVQREG